MTADNRATEVRLPRDCTFTPADWLVLSRFWHPVAFSHDVGSAPVAARLLDQDLVVYRTSGSVVVAKDICLHRGAQLTLGRLDGDELECAYHGWRYGPDGQCTRIPSQPPGVRISPKARLFTYPATERYGLVWTCLAGPERPELPEHPGLPEHPELPEGPELPDWPEAEDPAYRWLALPPLDWEASSAREVDNFLDVSHFAFVHAGTFGNAAEPEIPEVKVERTARGLRYDFSFLANNPDSSPLSGQAMLRWDTSYHLTLPFSVRIWQQYPERGESYHVVFNASCPVSSRRSRTFFFVCRNFDFDVPAEEILQWEGAIMAEDQRIVESQRPEELPLNLHDELHVRADRMTTAYRRALTELGLGSDLTS